MTNNSVKMSFDKVPAEILLGIVSSTEDAADLVNLAISHPERFLTNKFNIFVQDAEKQVTEVAAQAQPSRPLLYTAIENGHSVETIRTIVQAYQATHQESIDGIWGSAPSALQPPLHFAVEAGRADLVPLLLDLGANPHIKYSKGPSGAVSRDCDQPGFVHRQCTVAGVVVQRETTCDDAIETAVHAAIDLGNSPDEAKLQAIEDCALELTHRGVSLQPSPHYTRLLSAALANMTRLIKAVLGPLAARDDNDQEKRQFRTASHNFLAQVANQPKRDGLEELIEYLGYLGGPNGYLIQIEDPLPATRPFSRHLVKETLDGGNPRNAASLLKVFLRRGIFTSPDDLVSCAWEDANLSFTKVFYQKLGDGSFNAFMNGPPSHVQEWLLRGAIGGRESASQTCKWLIAQGCPTAEHVKEATSGA
ncbi:hypothetical protein F5X99DRAFT_427512 [Biscogniauxia marginata]|nr:hypothetical protein F5X99DRAFT_427512 [Biscogniauxia marginata]